MRFERATFVLAAIFASLSLGWSNPGPSLGVAASSPVEGHETLEGTVTQTFAVAFENKRPGAFIVLVSTGQDQIVVEIVTDWLVEEGELGLAAGDRVEITGNRIETENDAIFVAVTIRKGRRILVLRDEGGAPTWSGWRH